MYEKGGRMAGLLSVRDQFAIDGNQGVAPLGLAPVLHRTHR
jgi:hypothetical protein